MSTVDLLDPGTWCKVGIAARESEAIRLATDLLFEQTAVDQIVCITDARNLAANRLLRRMRMDHVRTEDALFRGEPFQEHVFWLSRETHLSHHKSKRST